MLSAKEIMATDVITVQEDTSVKEIAAKLTENRISGMPVLDAEGNLTGVVTENDLIDRTKKIHIPTMISILDSVICLESSDKMEEEIKKMTGATAGDICCRNPVTVGEDTPLDEVATIMAEKKIHTLPVVSDGRLMGVIGKADIIRTLAK